MTEEEGHGGPAEPELRPLERQLRASLGEPVSRRRILGWLALTGGSGAALAAGLYPVLRADPLLRGLSRRTLALAAELCAATSADIEGPFYVAGAPRRAVVAGPDEPGDRLVIRGRVLGADCHTPAADALVDVWQADTEGRYHTKEERWRLRGRILADATGAYAFTTILPGRYRIDEKSSYRPAHIHFKVSAPNARPLTTQLYFRGDPYLAPRDACGSECHSDDPGRIVELRRAEAGNGLAGTFDIVLERTRT